MTTIAVDNIPLLWNLQRVVSELAKIIKGNFTAENFTKGKVNKHGKLCYLRLSPKLDAARVCQNICGYNCRGKQKLTAYIPKVIPQFKNKMKPRHLTKSLRRKFNIIEELQPSKVVPVAFINLMTELQYKYPGLYGLSEKNDHELIRALADVVKSRINLIVETCPDSTENHFDMTRQYRRLHPHFADFQLILKTLQGLEDAAGRPRTQISEEKLASIDNCPDMIDNALTPEVDTACRKYVDRMSNKIVEHINNLDVDYYDHDTEEDYARKRVRRELQNMVPYLPGMISQVMLDNFVIPKETTIKITLYGEPFLPGKDTMQPFLRPYHAQKVTRSSLMYNMIKFEVSPAHYKRIMSLDGTSLGGAKLIIRPSFLPTYRFNAKRNEHQQRSRDIQEDMEEDVWEL